MGGYAKTFIKYHYLLVYLNTCQQKEASMFTRKTYKITKIIEEKLHKVRSFQREFPFYISCKAPHYLLS